MKKLFLAACLITINIFLVFSQDGSVDLTFNSKIYPKSPVYNGFVGEVYYSKILSSGKILVFGDFKKYMDIPVNNVALLYPDGLLDTSFNVGTGPVLTGFSSFYDSYCNLISEQSDGKIILGGAFDSFNGVLSNGIIRLNPNGSIDETFNIGTGFKGVVRAIKLQSDGKILCGGNITSYNNLEVNNLIRLNPNGSIDTSFQIDQDPLIEFKQFRINAIECQSDGKILVGGMFDEFNGLICNGLVRLLDDGTNDNSFKIGTGVNKDDFIHKIYYDNQTEKILVAGKINFFNGKSAKNIVSLNIDGTINESFNPKIGFSEYSSGSILDFDIFSNRKIIICGNFEMGKNKHLFVFNEDGSEDLNFRFKNYLPRVNTVSVDKNDDIYVSGYFEEIDYKNYKGNIFKIFANGSSDITFNPNLGAYVYGNGSLNAVLMNNGRILVGTSRYNEESCKLLSINQDGSIYTQDFKNFIDLDMVHSKAVISKNNKLYVTNGLVYRIFENGKLDDSFSNTSNLYTERPIFNVNVLDIAEQSDEKIIIAGYFRIKDNYYQNIARLNEDGTLDPSFNVGLGFRYRDNQVNSVVIQKDNKIIAVGDFNQYNDVLNLNKIVRLNSDGTIDNTFYSGKGFNNTVRRALLTHDNKLIVIGMFTQYDGNITPYIVRLNLDGSVDKTFNSPFADTGMYSDSNNIALQSNGKILISINIGGTQKLHRLNIDGSIDDSFESLTFTHELENFSCDYTSYDIIKSIVLLQNKIIITGCFDYLNGYRRVGIAMLNNSEDNLTVNEFISTNYPFMFPNPFKDCFNISDKKYDTLEVYSVTGNKILSKKITGNSFCIDNIESGLYIAKFISKDGSKLILKVLKE